MSDEKWRQAVAYVRAHYGEDIFNPDGTSISAATATFARGLCDQIVRLATDDGELPALCDWTDEATDARCLLTKDHPPMKPGYKGHAPDRPVWRYDRIIHYAPREYDPH